MKKFIAIIGNRNSGKSTIIKSLTGCPSSCSRGLVTDMSSSQSILVICSSPQEDQLTLAEFKKLLKRSTSNSDCRGLVMAIQPTIPRTRLSMEQIFKEVISTYSFQSHIFILSPGRNEEEPDTKAIISRLKTLKLKPTTLDGRRFAMINAQIINDKTCIAQ